MKASELSIGDWVVYNGDTEYIYPIRIEGMDIATGMCITSDREDVGFDGVEPIPITPEILEKNGIRYQWGELWWQKEGDIYEVVHNDKSRLRLRYVHELQHALRLAGVEKEVVV